MEKRKLIIIQLLIAVNNNAKQTKDMFKGKQSFEDGTITGRWHIDETVEELLEKFDNPADIEKKIVVFLSEKRRLEFLAVRVLLKQLLGCEKAIDYNLDGSPYLKDRSYNISISHSGKDVAIALNPQKRVGIDLERIGDKVFRVKNKYLSASEQSFVEADSEKIHLTLLWCAKEALYKIVGNEIKDIINGITILPFVPYISGIIEGKAGKDEYILNYQVEPEICLVWTVK